MSAVHSTSVATNGQAELMTNNGVSVSDRDYIHLLIWPTEVASQFHEGRDAYVAIGDLCEHALREIYLKSS